VGQLAHAPSDHSSFPLSFPLHVTMPDSDDDAPAGEHRRTTAVKNTPPRFTCASGHCGRFRLAPPQHLELRGRGRCGALDRPHVQGHGQLHGVGGGSAASGENGREVAGLGHRSSGAGRSKLQAARPRTVIASFAFEDPDGAPASAVPLEHAVVYVGVLPAPARIRVGWVRAPGELCRACTRWRARRGAHGVVMIVMIGECESGADPDHGGAVDMRGGVGVEERGGAGRVDVKGVAAHDPPSETGWAG